MWHRMTSPHFVFLHRLPFNVKADKSYHKSKVSCEDKRGAVVGNVIFRIRTEKDVGFFFQNQLIIWKMAKTAEELHLHYHK